MSDRDAAQDSGLTGLIASTPYQQSQGDPSQGDQAGEAGVPHQADNLGGQPGNEGLSPAAGTVPNPATGATGQDGVTNQPSPGSVDHNAAPDPRDAQIQELTETIQNATRFIHTLSARQEAEMRQRAQQEEQEFQDSLRDMEPEERQVAIERRELQKLREQTQQYQTEAQRRHAETQMQAKSVVAMMTASDYGLPPSAQRILMRATTAADMNNIAQDLVNRGYGRQPAQQPVQQQPQYQQQPQQYQQYQQQAQQQPQVNPAHLGGDASASSDVTQKVEYGSGDLMGLIQQTQWTR